jgi:hypothetical protein
MYRFHAAYLHDDGSAEGFIGYGFSPDAAEQNATKQVVGKLGDAFKPEQFVRAATGMTAEQLQQVLTDWRDTLKAKRAAGHSII